MAENTELEAFLQESVATPVSDPPEPAERASTGDPASPSPAPAAAVQDEDDADDASPASTEEGRQTQPVPHEALEAERRRRQDWKERAVRAETEREELRRQVEEARRAQAPAPQPPPMPMPIPDPAQDPAGYQAHLQGMQINHHLNISEMMARREHGDEKIDALIKDFREAVGQDPALLQKLYQQRDPYAWAYREVERIRTMREMGDDPTAWRAKIEADARSKWEAEQAAAAAPEPATAAPASRVASMAPSLANARSAAPRAAPAYTGPVPLEELFPPYHERVKQRR